MHEFLIHDMNEYVIFTETAMKIVNPYSFGDFHIHSSTLSDGLNTIDEIASAAGDLGYAKIAITDHNQYYMDQYGFPKKTHYSIIFSGRWKNTFNDVDVRFGVEADLLNEDGEICRDIQGLTPEFCILSSHRKIYNGNRLKVKQSYLNAIRKHGDMISLLGHLCSHDFSEILMPEDIVDITKAANEKNIPLELNCANLQNKKTSLPNLEAMLSCCRRLFVNSDAHTLHEMKTLRKSGFEYLNKNGYLRRIS